MYIIEVCSGICKNTVISKTDPFDLKILGRKKYFFNWRLMKKTAIIYKLTIEGEEDILGVMALVDHPDEKRIEIKLLACSIENRGKNKRYDRIAGCLIAFACCVSADKYWEDACVSLLPKTALINHYKQKYKMVWGGWHLYLEGDSLHNLLKEYST
jgi:hypothetical protein